MQRDRARRAPLEQRGPFRRERAEAGRIIDEAGDQGFCTTRNVSPVPLLARQSALSRPSASRREAPIADVPSASVDAEAATEDTGPSTTRSFCMATVKQIEDHK